MSKCPEDQELIESLLQENAELYNILAVVRHALASSITSAIMYLGETTETSATSVIAFSLMSEDQLDVYDETGYIEPEVHERVYTFIQTLVQNSPNGERMLIPEIVKYIEENFPYRPDEDEVIH